VKLVTWMWHRQEYEVKVMKTCFSLLKRPKRTDSRFMYDRHSGALLTNLTQKNFNTNLCFPIKFLNDTYHSIFLEQDKTKEINLLNHVSTTKLNRMI
jgi:hypothetical protein